MKVIENVIDREVVGVEVASSELGDSWTLAEKVRNSFLLMSSKEAMVDGYYPSNFLQHPAIFIKIAPYRLTATAKILAVAVR